MSLITDIQVRDWGTELELDCLDDPLTRRGLKVVFKNYREIHWSIDIPAAMGQTEADVIAFSHGRGEYAEPAVLTTDLFEVSVSYDWLEFHDVPVANAGDSKKPLLIKR